MLLVSTTLRSEFNNPKDFEGWSCTKITSCGKFGNVCGGYGVKAKGAEIKKTFQLPAGAYSVTLDFIKLDTWLVWCGLLGAITDRRLGVKFSRGFCSGPVLV